MFGRKKVDAPKIEIRDVASLDKELDYDLADLNDKPFTTTLGPQELYLLAKTGFEPFQVVVGTIVYSMGLRGVVRTLIRAFTRGEMTDFSHLQQIARDLAVARMRERASEIGAAGVVSIQLNAIHHADFIEVVAIGTAIREVGEKMSPILNGSLSEPEVVVGT